jgi:hypothetical protein
MDEFKETDPAVAALLRDPFLASTLNGETVDRDSQFNFSSNQVSRRLVFD